MRFVVTADSPASPDRVYAYLSDPLRRPEWQSSLRRVDAVEGTGGLGSSWYDVTWPGLRPHMSVTHAEPGVAWAEHGTWRGVVADLRLDLAPQDGGTRVTATVDLVLPRLLAPAGVGLRLLAPPAVRSDLRRAAAKA